MAETLQYDLDGNQTSAITATATNTYEWDAENRLTAVNEGGTNRSEFTYDGAGRRVQIVEKTNGMAYSTKTFVWCGMELCEERNSTGTTVTKRFFGQGEQISGTNYYFTRDHLGSIREMTDSTGTIIHARYDYDPYGNRNKISGDLDADFAFTGHYIHQASRLHLTLYRAYDSPTGRWPNRDPIAEWGGLNLYAYVGNDPVNYVDPLGLLGIITTTAGTTIYVSTVQQFINQVGAQPNGTIASINLTGHASPTSQGISDDPQAKEDLELMLGKYPMLTGDSINGKSTPLKDVLKNKMAPNGKINLDGCNAGGKNPDGPNNLPQAISSVVPDVSVSGSALSTFGPSGDSYGNTHIPGSINTYINGKKQ